MITLMPCPIIRLGSNSDLEPSSDAIRCILRAFTIQNQLILYLQASVDMSRLIMGYVMPKLKEFKALVPGQLSLWVSP